LKVKPVPREVLYGHRQIGRMSGEKSGPDQTSRLGNRLASGEGETFNLLVYNEASSFSP
jgi:hypothetical protein